jgi:glyoxalase family protein
MQSTQKISAIHHITAIAAGAAGNLAFYRNLLGLRLVKKTVNFDDPYTYHLYYGDDQGTPGTILTFFPWENLPRGRSGAGMVTAVAFAVPEESMPFWKHRLQAAGTAIRTTERFGEPVLQFSDPHGLPLELIGTTRPTPVTHWRFGPVPQAHAVSGFHSATATLNDLEPIMSLLKDTMGMTPDGREQHRYRFRMDDRIAPGHFYDVVFDAQATPGRAGSGTVHHIAFRTQTDADQVRWQGVLRSAGLGVTDVRDRKYFRSIYFHSPGGVLFEIATDHPGFAIDESTADMGSALQLPSQYEHLRAELDNRLPPLQPDALKHVFEGPS